MAISSDAHALDRLSAAVAAVAASSVSRAPMRSVNM